MSFKRARVGYISIFRPEIWQSKKTGKLHKVFFGPDTYCTYPVGAKLCKDKATGRRVWPAHFMKRETLNKLFFKVK